MKKTLTQKRLKKLLNYNSETGVFRWKIKPSPQVCIGDIAGCCSNGYTVIGVDSSNYMAHRLAWLYIYGEFPPQFIDHIDRDKSNNRISNLRMATNSQNQINAKIQSNNTSGYNGVFRNGGNWQARIKVMGSVICLGTYKTKEEAYKVRKSAEAEIFGEYSNKEIY